jgi:Chaperone of endosialidase
MKKAIPHSFIALLIVGLGLAQSAQALTPPPDGGYPGGNTAEGEDAINSLTSGTDNTAIGWRALFHETTGNANTATGTAALRHNTSGTANTANGDNALNFNTNGGYNTANGVSALYSNSSGTQNVANGAFALFLNTAGNYNMASGVSALYSNTTADYNSANGYQTLYSNTTGKYNTATGASALYSNTTGNYNMANGGVALFSNTTGIGNTGSGHGTLYYNTTGNHNVALGFRAGQNLTTGSNNIDIANEGVAGESNTIRIGGEAVQTACYIAGVSQQTTLGGSAVYVDANGKLGTATSSERFKDNIKPMDKASEAILALKPVTFRYKKQIDSKGIPQFGLVAEDVEKVNPGLVVRDKEGKPYTVRYDQVNAMLLNEFLKEHRKNEQQEGKIREQAASIATLKSTVAQQQKGMEAVTARLNEQAAQIQKVSAQLEASKPAPQVVNNP